jgi:hypothetical protein
MTKAHIIEARNANGWATMFCGRSGEKKATDGNSYLSPTGKTFFIAYPVDDAVSLNAHVNCSACQRALDEQRVA